MWGGQSSFFRENATSWLATDDATVIKCLQLFYKIKKKY